MNLVWIAALTGSKDVEVMNRVRIGTCVRYSDVAVIRCLFGAYDIPVLLNGESNHTMLVQIGAQRIDIFVDEADAEDATELLAELRGGGHGIVARTSPSDDATSDDEAPGLVRPLLPADRSTTARSDAWGHTALALLLGTTLGFGGAHLYYRRDPVRALTLAALQLGALAFLGISHATFVELTCIVRLTDALGVLWQLWSRPHDICEPW
jgi:hypothetical protein